MFHRTKKARENIPGFKIKNTLIKLFILFYRVSLFYHVLQASAKIGQS